MTTATVKYLSDYQQPSHWIQSIDLTFEILNDRVLVKSKTFYHKNQLNNENSLRLSGSSKLLTILLDDQAVSDYQLLDEQLTLTNLKDNFSLTIETEVDPFNNKSCMGLYASNGNLFTQCEPEGFRKITYYLDRPDVMAVFTTSIIADPLSYPTMLANGNMIQSEILADGRQRIVWQDPFKKPSYLFALVAGKFSRISDTFITKSGKSVALEVYSEADSIDQCQHCLVSLQKAMRWDEQCFNLEYDLERYMIVASNDFNMGAMENKGLNIFNTKYVLAASQTATDSDFVNVEAVVGHEYFHNWTGNRVTCRDWFQLSLKEGLTVFRDQEFTADLHSRQVKRIQDVKNLRQNQFSEDASPLAHPVRPASYLEINNFYTKTIYEKGSEVVRMYQTLLGKDGFKRGMRLYFARHDGQAVTCDEFCAAMCDANHFPLEQFMLWYSQAGTPLLTIRDSYDSQLQQYTLEITQSIPPTPDQEKKLALLIPLQIAFFSQAGEELKLQLVAGELICPEEDSILVIRKTDNRFIFKAAAKPTPSLLRNFSAPVRIDYPYTQQQLLNLAAHDNDAFNRWEAMQTLYNQVLSDLYLAASFDEQLVPHELFIALQKSLQDPKLDPSMKSLIASLPSFSELALRLKPVEVPRLNQAIQFLRRCLANRLHATWLACYHDMQSNSSYQLEDANQRALKNTALAYLMAGSDYQPALKLVAAQFAAADNMTDKLAALIAINDCKDPLRSSLLTEFYLSYAKFPLVMDKWFTLQSQSQLEKTISEVQQLMLHPAFDKHNPNKLYALLRAFSANSLHFNSAAGYALISAEILRIDKFNSGVAGIIAQGFSTLSNLSNYYQDLAKPLLRNILAEPGLSKDVHEIIAKTLQQL